jgi:bifunctional non-homologous end joining protein LigD
VSKRKNGSYESGRSHNWTKSPCKRRDTFAVIGWARKDSRFDGLYLGQAEGGRLVYAGKVERGFDEAGKKAMIKRLEPLRVSRAHAIAPTRKPKARWVRPQVLVDVEFRGRTGKGDGLLRHPSYKGVREDLM